jgi:DNA polymerase-3 subunit gamma/tau
MTGETYHTKYRPTTLDEVVGQDHIKDGLAAVMAAGKQQTFLFEGPSGTGKTTLARLVAAQMGCTTVREFDAATHTGVDAMRKVAEGAQFVSMDGGNQAFIIDECHRMSKPAWESLLKDIEEPPAGVFWFFCTTEPNKILKTIRTRCITYTLLDVPWRKLLRLLASVVEKEQLLVTEEILDICAEEAGGSPRQALVNLATVEHCKTPEEALAALNRTPGSKAAIDLARMLSKDWSIADAAAMLKEMKDESPESVRMVVFHYYLTACLGGSLKHLIILDEFEKYANDGNKMGDIMLRLTRIKKRAK